LYALQKCVAYVTFSVKLLVAVHCPFRTSAIAIMNVHVSSSCTLLCLLHIFTQTGSPLGITGLSVYSEVFKNQFPSRITYKYRLQDGNTAVPLLPQTLHFKCPGQALTRPCQRYILRCGKTDNERVQEV
jgi:hypothetical protein